MRLRVLELPTEVTGDDVVTPFLMVFDKVQDREDDADNDWEGFRALSPGFRGALYFPSVVEFDQ